MSAQMIRLADAQAAIRSVIEAYQKDINEACKAAAELGPEDSQEDKDAAACEAIMARAEQDGADKAYAALKAVPVFEAVTVASTRIVDKKYIPERMHDTAEEQAIRTMLADFGKHLNEAGMVKGSRAAGLDLTQTKITLRLEVLQPVEGWAASEGGEQG